MKLPRRCGTALSTLVVGCALIAPGVASAETGEVLAPELQELATPALQSASPSVQAAALGVPADGPGSLELEGGQVTVEVSLEGSAAAALPALRSAGAEVVLASDAYQVVTVRIAPDDLEALVAIPGVTAVDPVRAPMISAVEPRPHVDQKAICEGGETLTEGLDQLGVVTQPRKGGEEAGAREEFSVRGKGETIGVISDSYDAASTIETYNPEEGVEEFELVAIPTHAAEDIQTDDLPGPAGNCSGQQTAVDVLEEGPSTGHDEGRAMLQIVHDIAPHASLAFATAAGGELNFAHNIERLAAPVSAGGAGANVIVDDAYYFEEPMFQDGPIAAAIAKVTASGVTYVTAAGNANLFTYNEEEKEEGVFVRTGLKSESAGSWETAEFTDTKEPAFCPIPVGVAQRHCLNFAPNPGTEENPKYAITIEKHKPIRIAVGWSEPWYGLKADLDVYLLYHVNKKKALIKGETAVATVDKRENINGTNKPAAFVEWTNPEPPEHPHEREEVFVVVNRCVGNVCAQGADPNAKPRVKMIILPTQTRVFSTSYSKSEGKITVGPSVFGHAGAAAAMTVGASGFTTDSQTINYAGLPESYSSRGPVTHYWGPVTSTTPAAALSSAEVVSKPNVVATDCNATTFFTQLYLGFWRFCGTSAAAPHVAGIVALMRQTSLSQSPAGLKTALTVSAAKVPGYEEKPYVVGAGLVRARQAIEALTPHVAASDPASTIVAPIPPNPPAPEPEEHSSSPTPSPSPSPSPSPNSGATGGESKSGGSEKEQKKIQSIPTTTIKSHPAKLVKSRVGRPKLKFIFTSDQKGATFECSVDGSKWSICAAQYKAPFTLGPHEVKVRARDADGDVDKTPAVWKFKVKLVA